MWVRSLLIPETAHTIVTMNVECLHPRTDSVHITVTTSVPVFTRTHHGYARAIIMCKRASIWSAGTRMHLDQPLYTVRTTVHLTSSLFNTLRLTLNALELPSIAIETGPAVAVAAIRSVSLPEGILTIPASDAPTKLLLNLHCPCWGRLV